MVKLRAFQNEYSYRLTEDMENFISRQVILPEDIISISYSTSKSGYVTWYHALLAYND